MGWVQASDVKGLLTDEELMTDIAKAVVESPGVLKTLAEDIAGALEEEIENEPEFRRHRIAAAMGSADFKRSLATQLVSDIDD